MVGATGLEPAIPAPKLTSAKPNARAEIDHFPTIYSHPVTCSITNVHAAESTLEHRAFASRTTLPQPMEASSPECGPRHCRRTQCGRCVLHGNRLHGERPIDRADHSSSYAGVRERSVPRAMCHPCNARPRRRTTTCDAAAYFCTFWSASSAQKTPLSPRRAGALHALGVNRYRHGAGTPALQRPRRSRGYPTPRSQLRSRCRGLPSASRAVDWTPILTRNCGGSSRQRC
jgi:hypothetical protein